MRESGTSVATETCGQSMPLKFRITFWEYWIWVEVTLSLARLGDRGGWRHQEHRRGPAGGASARIASGGWPGVQDGTVRAC